MKKISPQHCGLKSHTYTHKTQVIHNLSPQYCGLKSKQNRNITKLLFTSR